MHTYNWLWIKSLFNLNSFLVRSSRVFCFKIKIISLFLHFLLFYLFNKGPVSVGIQVLAIRSVCFDCRKGHMANQPRALLHHDQIKAIEIPNEMAAKRHLPSFQTEDLFVE